MTGLSSVASENYFAASFAESSEFESTANARMLNGIRYGTLANRA